MASSTQTIVDAQDQPPAQSQAPAKRTIECLQAGRGLAALAVVFHHSAQAAQQFIAPFPGDRVLLQGSLGVDFFFVLSGFIIYHSTVGKGRSVRDYAAARFRRVYLPYWPIGIAVAVMYILMPTARPWSWITTLTLAPIDSAPALTVAWTLQHEVLFYLLFGISYFTRLLPLGLLLWALAILFGPDHLAFETINLEFFFGIAAAILVRQRRAPLFLALASPLPLLLMLVWPDRILFAAAIALLIAPLAQAEMDGRFTTHRALIFLGAISYSLYLIHYPIVAATARVVHNIPGLILTSVLSSLAAATAYHFAVERRVISKRKNPEVFAATTQPPSAQQS